MRACVRAYDTEYRIPTLFFGRKEEKAQTTEGPARGLCLLGARQRSVNNLLSNAVQRIRQVGILLCIYEGGEAQRASVLQRGL